MDIYTDELDP